MGGARDNRSPRRRPRSASRTRGAAIDASRRDAEQRVLGELEAWRARAVPDASAPLEVDDLVRLFRDFVAALALDRAIAAELTTNTVHYYRRRDIIDPPEGRTAAARWSVRHLWQIAGARLAGHLGLATLADAREAMRGATTPALLAFVAARVTDARAREAVRAPATDHVAEIASTARALPTSSTPPEAAVMIPLPGDAWAVVPASHAAHRSAGAATALARALTVALRGAGTPRRT